MFNTKLTLRFFTIVIVVLVVFLLPGCLQKFNNYGVKDVPVVSADGKLLVALVAENAATTYSENGGYRKTTYRTTYWLKQYELATARLVKKQKLATNETLQNQTIEMFGSDGKTIWLHSDQLRAYDITTLEEATNGEKIAVANNKDRYIFPVDDRLIRPFIALGFIDFISDNGDAYRLTLNDLKIRSKDELPENDAVKEPATSRRFSSDDAYGTRCDSVNGRLYMFAKDSAAANGMNPGSSDINEAAYRMKLFTAGYILRKLGMHNSITAGAVSKIGDSTYLNPCFIKEYNTDQVMHLTNPDGFLIVHQDVLGSNSKAIISRIDNRNKTIWRTATEVSTKISSCIQSGGYCIITTNKNYMTSPFIGKDALCIVAVQTGKVLRPALND